jgi:hypothetical protein
VRIRGTYWAPVSTEIAEKAEDAEATKTKKPLVSQGFMSCGDRI